MTRVKIALTTIGCKLNQFETVAMSEVLRERGYEIVPFGDKADIYVVNTCSVTSKTDYRCRQYIRRAIKSNPDAAVVAVGCYAQRQPEALASLPGVRLVLDNREKMNLPEHIGRLNGRQGPSPEKGKQPDKELFFPRISAFGSHTRAFVKIQDGCDSRCAYCVVWQLRGPNRSEDASRVAAQVRHLSAMGYREVVLTGIHLGTWGMDLEEPSSLAGLLESLAGIKDGPNIRLSSIEPNEFDERLISTLAAHPKICRHLHIPMQGGSDRILKLMRRQYAADDLRRLVLTIKDRMPEAAIGADIIVGFPGETEEDFEQTFSLVEELPLSYLHVFNYSRRPGTEAADMAGQVPAETRKARSLLMRDLGRKKALAFRRQFIGRPLTCLIENKREKKTGLLRSISGNYIKILIDGPDGLFNTNAEVIIDRIDDGGIFGHLR